MLKTLSDPAQQEMIRKLLAEEEKAALCKAEEEYTKINRSRLPAGDASIYLSVSLRCPVEPILINAEKDVLKSRTS